VRLPIFITGNKDLVMMQNKWSSILNPIIGKPQIGNSQILHNIQLASGTNFVNHLLGQKLQGWSITRQRGSASIYDNQNNNQHPDQTLSLVSSAPVNVDILVF